MNEPQTIGRRLGLNVERVWVWRDDADGGSLHCCAGRKPADDAAEYMRVMSRDEVEKLALSEDGVDSQQFLNSLTRTIEGQRREINRLNEKLNAASRDSEDAAKWRALRNCARMTAMGSAGLGPERAADDYAHVTLNFWTGGKYDGPGPEWAREWLDLFVAKALRALSGPPYTLSRAETHR